MKKSCFNLESSMKADRLAELAWEKDESVMRRPFLLTTTAAAAAAAATMELDQPHHHQPPPYVISDTYSKKSSSLQNITIPLLPTDSYIVPDNDHDHDEHHVEHEFMGNYLISTGNDHHKTTTTSTKVIKSSSHDHHVINSRQIPNCDDDDDHYHQITECNCKKIIKTSSRTKSDGSNSKGTSNSTSSRAVGLLDFITTHFSRAHDRHDGRPAVVATAMINSTPKSTHHLDHHNPSLLVPTNDHDDQGQYAQPDHYPLLNSSPKQVSPSNSKAPATTPSASTSTAKRKLRVSNNHCCKCGCDEALVPSFSVCSNDVPSVSVVRTKTSSDYEHHDDDDDDDDDHNTTQDDSECPCKSVEVEEEPQLRPPSSYKAPSSAAKRKGRTTAVHNLSERRRRDKINKKMRMLQALIPNCKKVNKASILDEAITYMKTLQLQLQMMSMGAGVMPPNPMMLGSGAPPPLRTTFALPHPTFHMLGFAPPPPSLAAPFIPFNMAPSLSLVPPSTYLSLSSSKNSNPIHRKHDHHTKS